MNRKILILSFFILHFTFFIRLSAEDTWIQTYQPFGDEVDYFVEDIRVCPDEGYAVIGSIWNSEFSTNDGFMMKTDSAGNMLWASIDTVDFVAGPEPSGFVVLDDGSFITVGNNFWFGGRYLLKRNPDGVIEWTIELDNDYSVKAIELSNDGDMVTTGGSMDGAISLQKFDLNGNLIWCETYLPDGFEFGGGYSITHTIDGGYAITGSVYGDNNRDIIVIKTDENGDSLWTWTYDGTANYDDAGQCIIENSESEFLIGGYISNNINRDYFGFLIKMNSYGDTIWTEKVNGMSAINSLVQTQDSNYILQGNNITKISDNHEIIWQVPRLVGLNASGDRTILELPDQNFIYLGKHYWGDHITIVKCDSSGQVTAIDENFILPIKCNLRCFPNPFNPIINFDIKYNNEQNQQMKIEIFNVKGQKIETIPFENKTITWDASGYSSGIYFCKLVNVEDGNILSVKKVTLLK